MSGSVIASQTCSVSSGTLTGSFVIANVLAGAYTITATGSTGDSALATFTVSAVVTTTSTSSSAALADFTLASPTAIVTLTQGSSGLATITVNSINSFNSPITLVAAWLGTSPVGVSLTVTSPVIPASGGTASSTLSVRASSTASTGTFTVRVIGTSGSLTHNVTPDFTIQITPAVTTSTTAVTSTAATTTSASSVNTIVSSVSTLSTVSIPPLPKCLIATATFGSDLAPEVQLLRDFRDNSIMKTMAGSSFMIAFNTWYYSFSPYVASHIQGNVAGQTVMKGVLYPAIGILWLSSTTFDMFRSYPEVAALLSGLLASSLIGVVYVGLPAALIRTKVKRLRDSRRQRILQITFVTILVLGLVGLGFGELLIIKPILILSTVIIILSSLLLTSIVTSNKIANALQRKARN
ncbi:MAG TPA: CFI-box-CTERM domain-containing protein [Candidatus Bathyarchaeia archaeon]|nr:CFI-box-CTERM domain-containing protein [Candidatus Bathyarchaeia archaeon]